jgi:toluene monooxygenase system protein E
MPKTFWHLLTEKRVPTDYELVSSQLTYHTRYPTAVHTPVSDFHARHACDLQVPDWEDFADPQQTTYASYVATRRDREVFADQLLAVCDSGSYDSALPSDWLAALDAVLSPLRYPCHGLQLAAAYVAQAAPSGRLTVMAGFQASDELRRISRLAYRTRQLMDVHPSFASHAKQDWQNAEHWQPLRALIEQLLVTYHWSEAFCALNLTVKPLFDALYGSYLASLALAHRDDVLGRLLLSLHEDQRWHAEVAGAWARFAIGHGHQSRITPVLERWLPRTRDALLAAAQPLGALCEPGSILQALEDAHAKTLMQCGLQPDPLDLPRSAE